MERFRFLTVFFLLILLFPAVACAQTRVVDRTLDLAVKQAETMLEEVRQRADSLHVSPRTLTEAGDLELVRPRDWTSGFFAGNLWQLYDLTKDTKWAKEARIATAKLEDEKWNGRTHDMGFKIYCSFGSGYRFTGDTAYRNVIVQAAKTLAMRFNPTVGAIRSWDHNSDRWDYPVIIDNMLNLELLFAATRLTGDSTFYRIAVAHANTTLENHFRADGSTYHVVDYVPATGEVEHRHTHQGYSHGSTWARGQAWALYGYTLCFRETRDPRYLDQAVAIARWLIERPGMPEDGVPYWDFDAPHTPDSPQPRDASAAAIIASALYELSTFVKENTPYLHFANHIIDNLAIRYTAEPGTHRGFILLHSTGHMPKESEVDVPLIYADYYFLEALRRKKEMID